MFDLVFIEQDSLALPKLLDISVLIGGGSNPTRITANLGFEFQERVDVLYKQSPSPVAASYLVTAYSYTS